MQTRDSHERLLYDGSGQEPGREGRRTVSDITSAVPLGKLVTESRPSLSLTLSTVLVLSLTQVDGRHGRPLVSLLTRLSLFTVQDASPRTRLVSRVVFRHTCQPQVKQKAPFAHISETDLMPSTEHLLWGGRSKPSKVTKM